MECGGKTKMKSGGNWIKGAIKNPGSFTKQAQSAGMSVPAFRDKVLANKGDYSGTTVKRASLAKTLSGMKKGQSGMLMEEPPMTYTTVNRGEYKGRVFADREIDPTTRQARIEEVRALGRAGKLDRMQKQAAIDSVTTLNQMRNPNIISSKPVKAGGVCTPADVKNGNCRNKAEVHKQAGMGYGSGQSGMAFKDPMGADYAEAPTTSAAPTAQIRRPKATSSNLPAVDTKVKAIDPDLKQGKQMMGDLERQAERDNVRRYQQMLNTKYGLDLDVDGAWGKDTQAAYEKYVLKKSSSPSTAKKANTPSTYNPSRYPAKSASSEVKTDPNTPWKNRPVQMSRTPEINPFTDRRPTSFADYLNSVNMNAGKKPAAKVPSAKREGYAGYLDSVNTNRRMKSGGVKLKNYLK